MSELFNVGLVLAVAAIAETIIRKRWIPQAKRTARDLKLTWFTQRSDTWWRTMTVVIVVLTWIAAAICLLVGLIASR